jgi:acetoin utilization protein AcuB
MIIRNWMKRDPVTISSDALLTEAREIVDRHGLRYVAVVDNGVLRGILRRRDLYEAAMQVTSKQSAYELKYFNERLKVKDLMIRKPKTIQADEPVEEAMRKGSQLGVSFFPVMDGDRLVGTVSYEEIFETFAQVLGVREKWVGITLQDVEVGPGTIRHIAELTEAAGGTLRSVFTLRQSEKRGEKVVLRVATEEPRKVLEKLREAGYTVMEVERPEGKGEGNGAEG